MLTPHTWASAVALAPAALLYPAIAVSLYLFYLILQAVYNIFLHPLRGYPGPITHRASRIPWAISQMRGTKPFKLQKLHDKYGSVVRVAPNFLSYTDGRAWKEIYGHRPGPFSTMPKPVMFYGATGTLMTNISNADDEEHARLRKALAPGFSEKALREQEHMITRHVDRLLAGLEEQCHDGKRALEMEKWYTWTTFDIIGDLVFGQDFGGLKNTRNDPFIQLVFNSVRAGAILSGLRYLGFGFLIEQLQMFGVSKSIEAVLDNIGERLKERMESKDERPDLIEGLLRNKDAWELSFLKLRSNAMFLSVAGSETTATLLAGATYLLLTHPETMANLQHEVRSKFKHVDEINLSSVNSLEYMLAVLNETARYYPPVSGGNPRQVPDGGAMIAGRFVPGKTLVEVPHWAMYHSKENWSEPWIFNPERFLESEGSRDNLEVLQPFSYGPRNCIGQNLAIAEMRLILARMIYTFDMSLAPGSEDWIKRQVAFSIWIKIPLPVYLRSRRRS
ncbi:isotrichodermin C-15 hydroxylase [Thozetella sp. PMI_491]|nr:isotrichodermin C-15 hydroxylase [Thozetella sp. PMI_491]